MNNPLSFKNILSGIIVTVIGGIILALILQVGMFSPEEPQSTQVASETSESGEEIGTPIVTAPPTEDTACRNAPPKQLSVGTNAIVCTASESISLRSGPRRSASAIDHLIPGTLLAVISGAICDENEQWWYWEVRTDSGYTGWVSEGGDEKDPYFVCPSN